MAGRGTGESQFWSAEGLAIAAKVLIDYLDLKLKTQLEVANEMGYSSTAVGNFKANYPASSRVRIKADPDFILLLADVLPDPASHPDPYKRSPFERERLIRICRGLEELYPEKDEAEKPYPEPRRIIKQGMGTRTATQFASYVKLKPSRIREILEGHRPTISELAKIVGGLTDYDDVDELADLYGYGLRAQPKLILNGSHRTTI